MERIFPDGIQPSEAIRTILDALFCYENKEQMEASTEDKLEESKIVCHKLADILDC